MTTEMASPGLVGPQEHHAQIRGDGSDVGEARNKEHPQNTECESDRGQNGAHAGYDPVIGAVRK